MWARWVAGLVWAVVAATVVMWGLRLAVRPSPVPGHALPVGTDRAAKGDLARLFAAPAAPTTAAAPPPVVNNSSRLRLVGLVAPYREGAKANAVALIALDGKPPRAYRVGATIDEQWVLQSVSRRSASVGPQGGSPAVVLEMPPLPPASTGTLPRAGDGARGSELSAVPVVPPRPGYTPPPALSVQPPSVTSSLPAPGALAPRPLDANGQPVPERPPGNIDPNSSR